jgi:hypothetical protein
MGLIRRRNRFFYFRTERIGRKGRRYYCGCGVVARLAGETDAHLRERRAYRREMLNQTIQELAAMNVAAESLAKQVELLATARLLLAGWYMRKKSEWEYRG